MAAHLGWQNSRNLVGLKATMANLSNATGCVHLLHAAMSINVDLGPIVYLF
jgi:hypothetical protein